MILGVDIGGSHISSALTQPGEVTVLDHSFIRKRIKSSAKSPEIILNEWADAIHESLKKLKENVLQGIELRCRARLIM